ncbi:MAG: alpha-mannosidase, partial [Clostridia bacterium]|nr:alpha-mannosidase [Clostridia bacterium]
MKKIYMIGNTHFDPVWLWKWDEAMSSITATFRSALKRMEEYPEFKYSFATPPVFEWIKKTSPELFEEIKKRVKEGRWELSEGWWVQPDCYTPSGESLVRQGLYGQRYLKENFGEYSETVFNIDSFGHPPTLPQILDK